MNKLFSLLILLGMLAVVPSAMGVITATGGYFVADAQVGGDLGSDIAHNEDSIPVDAFASIGVVGNSASSMATAGVLSVSSWSLIDFQPQTTGGASSSAGSIIFGINSTTPWQIDLETLFSVISSVNGSVGLGSLASVFDGTGTTELYSYNLSTDGPNGQNTFGVGDYELRLFVSSFAAITAPSQIAESISSSVQLNATLTPIPVPGSALLAFLGVGLIHRLRRSRII